jgi:Polyketide cyclase / dehydrase and lipid transport
LFVAGPVLGRTTAGYGPVMISVERVFKTTPERVWDVLSDGWLYPLWVVGASRMREVDDSWPEVGSKLHHSVGMWPALLDDNTEVTDCDKLRMLSLRARAWPFGEAHVVLRLNEYGGGTRVVIEEDAVSGPGKLVPLPARAPGIKWRNVETLRRLAYIAERR